MRHPSLRWHVAAAFGLGSLLVTSLLAIATWNLASDYMLRQRVQATTRQAEVNVRLVEDAVNRESDGLTGLLTGLTTDEGMVPGPGRSPSRSAGEHIQHDR